MHLIYIDDSKDEDLCVFSALAVPADRWKKNFAVFKNYRLSLKKQHGIFMRTEFHATEFVAGRGQLGDRIVFKGTRCRIFKETLAFVTTLDGVKLFNACMPQDNEMRAFERLLNRINRTMQAWNSHALLICDEGKESIYTRLCRKMGVHNPIPSNFGAWPDGSQTRNIPLEYILEDPVFKESHSSYFVQIADFCAYSLLRRERQLPSKNKYGLHEAFNLLRPILVTQANRYDPGCEGIIR